MQVGGGYCRRRRILGFGGWDLYILNDKSGHICKKTAKSEKISMTGSCKSMHVHELINVVLKSSPQGEPWGLGA